MQDARNLLANVGPSIVRSMMMDISTSLRPLSSAGVYHFKDLPYVRAGHPKQQLDVFMAKQPFPRKRQPTLLFVHGGSWQRGDRRLLANLYQNVGIAAAAAGITAVIPSYRLAPEFKHPVAAQDIAAAVAWTRLNIHQYGGDPDALYLCGHSAGAHLAALLAVQPSYLHAALRKPGPPTPDSVTGAVKGYIGLCGPYNVTRLATSPWGNVLTEPVFGREVASIRSASPVYTVRKDSPIHRMPVLLLNAEEDFHLQADTEEFDMAIALHAPQAAATSSGQEAAAAAEEVEPLSPIPPPFDMSPPCDAAASSTDTDSAAAQTIPNGLGSTPASAAAAAAASASAAGVTPADSAPAGGLFADAAAPAPSVSWYKTRARNVTAGIVKGTNHFTLIGAVGQAGDATTAALMTFIKKANEQRDNSR